MKATMIGVMFAASSSAAAAFGTRSATAFRAPGAVRAFSRTTELFNNPKGTLDTHVCHRRVDDFPSHTRRTFFVW